MGQNNRIAIKEGKKTDRLPAELRKHYEDSMRHNHELMKRLAQF
ncbi:MAG: hypothetical protein Q8O41_05265 [Candidatus Methanoperedens sp.]|nr:hypothetical protein [Candidatus Methanoperedens sp.]